MSSGQVTLNNSFKVFLRIDEFINCMEDIKIENKKYQSSLTIVRN